MHDEVVAQLCRIVQLYGVDVCEDSHRVEALLRDLAGQHRREVTVLTGAAREGVPAALLTSGDGAAFAVRGERLVRVLQENLAMTDEAARWAVNAWATALGVPGVLTPAGPSAPPLPTSEPLAESRDRAALLLGQAEDSARSVSGEFDRVRAQAVVADVQAKLDSDRAARLFDRAERLADAYSGDESDASRPPKELLLMSLAQILAATDPDRALRIAFSITEDLPRAIAMTSIVNGLAPTSPDRAEQLAQSISHPAVKVEALTKVAVALHAVDPDRAMRLTAEAERAARSLSDEAVTAKMLATAAALLAAVDPGRAAGLLAQAESIAQSLTSHFDLSSVLVEIAKAMGSLDADRALAMADVLQNEYVRNQVLHRTAAALSDANPDRALQIAYAITDHRSRVEVMCGVGKAVATTDPTRSARLIADAERLALALDHSFDRTVALAGVASAWDDVGRAGVRPLTAYVAGPSPAEAAAEPARADDSVTSPPLPAADRLTSRLSSDPGATEKLDLAEIAKRGWLPGSGARPVTPPDAGR